MQSVISSPAHPVCWVVGGAKVSTKAALLYRLLSLLNEEDKIIIGGCMGLTFLKARGFSVGASTVEDSQLDTCRVCRL